MLPILARAAGRSMARKMMGRKTNVRVGQAQPQSSNAIVRSEKFTGRSAKTSSLPRPPAPIQKVSDETASKDDPLKVIHTKTLTIEKILEGTLASEKAELKRKKDDFKNQNRQEQEENLEKKDLKPDKKMKMPKVPGTGGIFGFIKNFLGNILMGLFLMKMVDNVGMLKGLFTAVKGITDFIADVGIKLVDGLATFVDWGYKAYDATKGFLANFGVKPELFDQFSGALSGLIDALIIGSVILASRGEDGFGPGGLDRARRPKGRRPGVTTGRGGQGSRFRLPGTRPRVTQGGGRRLPGAPVTQGRGGQGTKPRLPGTRPPVTGGGTKPKLPGGTKPRVGGGLKGAKTGGLIGLLLLIPTLFEVGGLFSQGYHKTAINVMISTLAGIVAGAVAAKAVILAAGALGLTGVGIPAAVALAATSLAAGALAGWGAFEGSYNLLKALGLRDDDPALKAQGYQEGGRVKKPIKRSIGGKKKPKAKVRKILRKPTPERLSELPQPVEKGGKDRAWWDFLGWAGTGEKPLGVGGEQLAQKVTDVGNNLGENDFFGPILRVTSKVILDQEVNNKDIKNVGLGINFLINKGLSDRKISESIKGYAQGGMVNPLGDSLSLEKWVEDSFKPLVKKTQSISTRYTSGGTKTSDMDEVSIRTTSSSPSSGKGSTSLTGDNQAKWKAVYAMAEKAGAKYPELVAAQFALESAWGTALAAKNNFFGIKATSGEDATVSNTREVVNGQDVYVDARFKNFDTPQDCIDHLVTQWYKDYKGYSGVNNASDAQAAADQLKREGYATDPQYAASLKRIMGEYTGIRGTNADIATSLVAPSDSTSSPEEAGKDGSAGSIGGDGKFIQGNSGASAGVHFHVGPGHQTDGTLLQSQYFADARASAKKVIDHFLGKGSTIYDGRRGVYFKSSDEVDAAQRAHTASGSAGGIDMQVDFETPHKFPLSVSSMAYRRNGFGVSANIDGSKSFVSHGRYDEKGDVAPQERMKLYHAGLRLGGKEQIAKILKGETVLDEDTTKALGPTLLARLDDASTPAGIQKVLESVMGISEFPTYDSRANQIIMIDDSDDTPMETPQQSAPVMIGALGGTSYDNSMDFLDYQG